jgi:hypothetical protein
VIRPGFADISAKTGLYAEATAEEDQVEASGAAIHFIGILPRIRTQHGQYTSRIYRMKTFDRDGYFIYHYFVN